MTYEEIIAKVSENTGFDVKTVKKACDIYWKHVRSILANMNVDNIRRDYENSKPGVRINGIGTIYIHKKKVEKPWKRRWEETDAYIKKIKYKYLKRKNTDDRIDKQA